MKRDFADRNWAMENKGNFSWKELVISVLEALLVWGSFIGILSMINAL